MKYIIQSFIFAFVVMGSAYVYADESPKHETKQVCVDQMKDGKPVKDPKTGNTKQTCRNVKQHKKLDVAK